MTGSKLEANTEQGQETSCRRQPKGTNGTSAKCFINEIPGSSNTEIHWQNSPSDAGQNVWWLIFNTILHAVAYTAYTVKK